MLQSEKKKEIVSQFAMSEGDTGSVEVQVALLTARISALTEHLKANSHDHNTRMGLLRLTARRRTFLSYLERTDVERYRTVVARLGLRR
ncbi:MAG: 30S ribosomal protein S15 [Dehalococcoidia bacterium]|nr:MAG: 30S ribosomal protein S15 [Dehalococcoidia bacterium]